MMPGRASGRERVYRFPSWGKAGESTARSYFLQQALEAEGWAQERVWRLEGDLHVDVCIVGGGFTGLWTAYRLKQQEPTLEVALVEADLCGAGASGRNGGGVVSWWVKFAKLVHLLGQEAASRLALAAVAAIDDLERFCLERGNGAHFARDGSLWVATSEAQMGAWNRVVEASDAAGVVSFESIEGNDLLLRLGGPPHLGGVIDRSAGTVQPALLARDLYRSVREMGVQVYEQSPVGELASGSEVVVRCPRGSVRAEKAVLAMNAWMAGLPDFRHLIVPVSSDIVLTEPIREELEAVGWPGRLQAHNSLMMVDYYGPTWDGRMLFGRGGGTLAFGSRIGSAFDHSPSQEREVTRDLYGILPWLSGKQITHAWSGPVDRCEASLPWFGTLSGDSRIHYGIGYSGSGICPAVLGGRILAAQVLGRRDEWVDLGALLNRIAGGRPLPPEPVRYLGGRLIQQAVVRKERAESAGRKPARLAAYLGRFVPGGLLDLKPRPGAR